MELELREEVLNLVKQEVLQQEEVLRTFLTKAIQVLIDFFGMEELALINPLGLTLLLIKTLMEKNPSILRLQKR